jgi:hypothetical protein
MDDDNTILYEMTAGFAVGQKGTVSGCAVRDGGPFGSIGSSLINEYAINQLITI